MAPTFRKNDRAPFVKRALASVRRSRAAPATVDCPCGKSISVAAEHRGRRIKCRQCGRELRVGPRFTLPPRYGAALTVMSLAYALGIFALTTILWRLGDVWWPATILLFFGRWIFLLPLLVLLPAALVWRRPLVAPLLIAAVICLGPLMGGRFGWHRLLPQPTGAHVRVLSFNVDGGDALAPRLADVLQDLHPDLVALQECGPALAEAVGKIHGWFHHQVRQLCFLSRYRIADSAVMDRKAFEEMNEAESAIGGAADVARYTVETPQGLISVTNLHLETPRKGLEGLLTAQFSLVRLRDNTQLRQIESDLARRWVDSSPLPAIVAGDFNTPVESRIFQKSWGDLTDAFSRVGSGFGMTRRNGWIRVRIDHVLTGPGWHDDRAQLGPDLGSDHMPVIADLTLQRTGPAAPQ